jgi:hypothetical protein
MSNSQINDNDFVKSLVANLRTWQSPSLCHSYKNSHCA